MAFARHGLDRVTGMNLLQACAQVSDNAVTIRDVAQDDAATALVWLETDQAAMAVSAMLDRPTIRARRV